jgi:probable phosphomutase (TIGR03848 family)
MAPSTPKTPPPTVICFVRHGTTPTTGKVLPGRAKGLHLSEKGVAEAERVAERLVAIAPLVAAVYASPLERTRETAKPIAAALGQRVNIDRGLLECEFGEWTGCELTKLAKLPEWQQVQRHPSGFRFPGGESFLELQARISTTVSKIVERHLGHTVIVVSHADPIKLILAEALGQPLDLMQRTVVSPCSVSVIAYGPVSPSVLAVNSSGDLTNLGIGPKTAERKVAAR